MKSKKIILALSFFLCINSIGYCDTSSFQKKLNSIKLTDPHSISKRANESPNASISSEYSEITSDPIVNSMINSYGYMMQGASGGSFNPQEQARQQMDYTKQKIQYAGEE